MLRLPYTEIRELTVSEVAARLGQPGCFVFDNGRRRWKRGHVPGAKTSTHTAMAPAS